MRGLANGWGLRGGAGTTQLALTPPTRTDCPDRSLREADTAAEEERRGQQVILLRSAGGTDGSGWNNRTLANEPLHLEVEMAVPPQKNWLPQNRFP